MNMYTETVQVLNKVANTSNNFKLKTLPSCCSVVPVLKSSLSRVSYNEGDTISIYFKYSELLKLGYVPSKAYVGDGGTFTFRVKDYISDILLPNLTDGDIIDVKELKGLCKITSVQTWKFGINSVLVVNCSGG